MPKTPKAQPYRKPSKPKGKTIYASHLVPLSPCMCDTDPSVEYVKDGVANYATVTCPNCQTALTRRGHRYENDYVGHWNAYIRVARNIEETIGKKKRTGYYRNENHT